MNIVVICNDQLREELLAQRVESEPSISFSNEITEAAGTDCYLDLSFDNDLLSPGKNISDRINWLNSLPAKLILVNAVGIDHTLLPAHFVPFNGWPTLLKNNLLEASSDDEDLRSLSEQVFGQFGKKLEWLNGPSVGFLSPKVISMIINEAYYALEEKVSSKEEIDTAMKLGTNYPYGPFEWSRKIGLKRVYHLLKTTATKEISYSSLLEKEALES